MATPIRKSSRLAKKAEEALNFPKPSFVTEPPPPAPAKTSSRQKPSNTRSKKTDQVLDKKPLSQSKKTKDVAKETKSVKPPKKETTSLKSGKAVMATKRAKIIKAAKTTKAAKDAKPPKTTRKTTKTKEQTSSDEQPPAKKPRKPRKPRITREKNDTNIQDQSVDAVEDIQDMAVKGKVRTISKKRKAKEVDDGDSTSGQRKTRKIATIKKSTKLVYTPLPVNPSDPCSVFPTEIWHKILDLLPLSQVAKISVLSKTWLYGSRAYPAWKNICDNEKKIGSPGFKYKNHMALVCSQCFWICDQCHSFSNGRPIASAIPLPVPKQDNDNIIWRLCRPCRINYYRKFPEESQCVDDSWGNRVTKTRASSHFHLTDYDLDSLGYEERRNPHYRSAYPMKLYELDEVEALALATHGGWIGVTAARNGAARILSMRFKERDDKFKNKNRANANGKGKDKAKGKAKDTDDTGNPQDQSQSQIGQKLKVRQRLNVGRRLKVGRRYRFHY
ncbi:hypothetical protein BGZ76_004886 [Entomortierella beljakovae]|nr:hypothetical protein BGZ76_004886 [Entomortierella beljakovae]